MKKIIFIFILAIPLFFFIRKSVIISEKDRILKTLRIVEKSLEEKQHIRFMKQISLEYHDSFGNSWGTLFFHVKNILQNYSKIKISLSHINIKIEDEKATVRFIGKGEAINPYGERVGEMGRFRLEIRKEGGKWKIIYFCEEEYHFTEIYKGLSNNFKEIKI